MPESPQQSSDSTESSYGNATSGESNIRDNETEDSNLFGTKLEKDAEPTKVKPDGDGRLLKVVSAMDVKIVDVIEYFFRELWHDFKNFKILRLSIRLFVISPVLILIWLFTVVQLFGFISDFDLWVPIAEWFNSSSASNPGNFDPPIPEDD